MRQTTRSRVARPGTAHTGVRFRYAQGHHHLGQAPKNGERDGFELGVVPLITPYAIGLVLHTGF